VNEESLHELTASCAMLGKKRINNLYYPESIKWSTMPKSERYQIFRPLTQNRDLCAGGKASIRQLFFDDAL